METTGINALIRDLSKTQRILFVGSILAILFSLLMIVGVWSENSGGGRNTAEDHYWAEVACEDSVSNQLKAPSTADYDVTVSNELRDGVWFVSGTVDAENTFGAKIRHHWTCNAERSSSDSWTAVATVN